MGGLSDFDREAARFLAPDSEKQEMGELVGKVRSLYDEFVAVQFSDDQAFTLARDYFLFTLDVVESELPLESDEDEEGDE